MGREEDLGQLPDGGGAALGQDHCETIRSVLNVTLGTLCVSLASLWSRSTVCFHCPLPPGHTLDKQETEK